MNSEDKALTIWAVSFAVCVAVVVVAGGFDKGAAKPKEQAAISFSHCQSESKMFVDYRGELLPVYFQATSAIVKEDGKLAVAYVLHCTTNGRIPFNRLRVDWEAAGLHDVNLDVFGNFAAVIPAGTFRLSSGESFAKVAEWNDGALKASAGGEEASTWLPAFAIVEPAI